MTRRFLWSGLALVLFGMALPLWGRDASKPSASITHILIQSVSITIRVSATDKRLVVPHCGEGNGGTQSLCYKPTNLQVESPQGWQPVRLRLRPNDRVLGSLLPREIQSIPAGESHEFSLTFSKVDFAVESGQRLRYIVDAWPDEKSMRAGGAPIHLATPPFECP